MTLRRGIDGGRIIKLDGKKEISCQEYVHIIIGQAAAAFYRSCHIADLYGDAYHGRIRKL